MRKTILLIIFILSSSSTKLLAQYEGTFGMGAHLDYGSEIQRPGIGLDIHYYLTNNLRVAPSLTYYMQVKNKSMWNIDGDFHYVVPLGVLFSIYPIAGIHYSEWKNMTLPTIESNEDRYNGRLGVNAGLGFQYDFSYKVRADFEIKYQAIRDYSQVAVALGIGFWI